ncbi:MAG: hypothetical protein QM698_06650 [Micropepsaceae bacterium]
MRRIVLALSLPVVLAACGESNRDVITRFTPQIEAVRGELKAIAGTLPAPGVVVSGKVADADPKPVYDVAAGAFNTAFVPVEALSDDEPVYDLILSSELLNALGWTGAKNPMAESALDESAEGFDKQFQTALATTYVVLYRAAAYDPPRAIDDKTFEGGTLKLEAVVFERAASRQVAACSIEAASDTSVNYTYKEGEDPKARLVAFAGSTLWSDALKTLAQCLTATTGGTFVFERS